MIGRLILCASLLCALTLSLESSAQDLPEMDNTVYRLLLPAHTPCKGPKDALLTMVEVGDFECPYCAKAQTSIAALQKKWKGKLRVCFVNLPLPNHKNAVGAALAAFAAQNQGKFWPMHDRLFAGSDDLSKEKILAIAKGLKLDVKRLEREMQSEALIKKLKADIALTQTVNINGTPAFFINGVKREGALPPAEFDKVLETELKRAQKLRKQGVKLTHLYRKLVEKGKWFKPKPYQPGSTVYRVTLAPHVPCRGPQSAPVTIVQFTNFECPFSQRVLPVIDRILKTYKRDVRFCFVNNPLPMHKNAIPAALAAMAAHKQKRFWKFYSALLDGKVELKAETYLALAKQLGLNLKRFKADQKDKRLRALLEKDADLAGAVGAEGTPFFYINGIKFEGARPWEHFKPVIDEQLVEAKQLLKKGVKAGELYKTIVANGKRIELAVLAPKAIPLPELGAPSIGNARARVVLTVFSDFQCPYCASVSPLLKQLLKHYKGKLRVQFLHFPLDFHADAELAAIASMAAHRQGKFWGYHDLLFQNQEKLKRDDLVRYAKQLGLDVARFSKDLADPALKKRVKAQLAFGAKIGVPGTPTFLINGRPMMAPRGLSLKAFQSLIDPL